jgi:hypothetical protein
MIAIREECLICWLFLAGGKLFRLAVNATTTVFVDYRYFATEDPEFSYRQEAEIDSHNISLGLRYSF